MDMHAATARETWDHALQIQGVAVVVFVMVVLGLEDAEREVVDVTNKKH